MVLYAPVAQQRGRTGRYLVPMVLAGLVAVIVVIIASVPGGGVHRSVARPAHTAIRGLRPYWTVRPGDTYGGIAAKTGLTVAQLEAFNPNVDPLALVPGQRLNLWRHPPKRRPKPLGPLFWTVRAGESFGSIAATTGINITTLEQLNQRLKPAALQPGDRVRLRR